MIISYLKIHYLLFYVRCKERLVINSMTSRMVYCEGQINFLKCGDNIVPAYPIYCDRIPYYPSVPSYASTIHQVTGQTSPHFI